MAIALLAATVFRSSAQNTRWSHDETEYLQSLTALRDIPPPSLEKFERRGRAERQAVQLSHGLFEARQLRAESRRFGGRLRRFAIESRRFCRALGDFAIELLELGFDVNQLAERTLSHQRDLLESDSKQMA